MNDQFEQILVSALVQNASDIHLSLKDSLIIHFRINNTLVKSSNISLQNGIKLVNFFKYSSSIDVNYRLKPQTGHFNFRYKNKVYYFRVSSIPTKDSESLVIRILNNLEHIDLLSISDVEHVQDYLKNISRLKKGLVLIGGATGSGKSTTLYTLLDYIYNNEVCNIITLEDPIEIDKPYCVQIQISEESGITYGNTLKQILRHDPDVIMIGEVRDQETAKLAIRAALTGHLVLATIHASNCVMMMHRLLDLDVHKNDLEEVLVGLINQTMIYDKKLDQRMVVLEYMKKEEIIQYIQFQFLYYYTYKKAVRELVDLKGLDMEVYRYF